MLDLLTSDQVVANIVKKIEVTVPSEHLSEGVVIIDTPGIGAGACGAESHALVTRNALEQSADVAVVLIPSASAMTDSLIRFLLQDVKPFLHRCVFVLTAMDQLAPDDQSEVARIVRLKIKEKLNLPNALVLESSAITMIPVKAIPASMMTEDIWKSWQAQFVQVEAQLKQVMRRQRNLIITERLVRLLVELINELSNELDKKKAKLAEDEKVLRENSVAAIEEVMNTLIAQSKAKIARQQQAIESYINLRKTRYRANAISNANKVINTSGYNINYDDNVAPKIRGYVKDQSISYAADIDAELDKLRNCCELVSTDFVRQFEVNYKNFPSLGVNFKVPSIAISSISVPSISFSSSRSYVEQQSSDDGAGAGVGAVIGGVLGFFIGGPFGAAAGAAIGGGTGLGVAGDSLEQRQRTLRSYAESDIEKYFAQYETKIRKQVGVIVDKIIDQLKYAADVHIKEYGERVNCLINEHRFMERRLTQEIEQITLDSQQLSQRKKHLENLKQKLLAS